MDLRFLFYIDNLTQRKTMDQINKLYKKLPKFKSLKKLHSLKLIGINKKMLLNHTKFTKEILSF